MGISENAFIWSVDVREYSTLSLPTLRRLFYEQHERDLVCFLWEFSEILIEIKPINRARRCDKKQQENQQRQEEMDAKTRRFEKLDEKWKNPVLSRDL